MTSKGFTNWGKYINERIDDLYGKGASVANPAERLPYYRQATEIFLADAPHVVIYHWNMLWGMSAKVQGFRGRPDGLWRAEGLSIDP